MDTKPGPDLSAVEDDMPVRLIWRQVLREIWGSLNPVSVVIFIFFACMLIFVGLIFAVSVGPGTSQGLIAILFCIIFFGLVGIGLFVSTAKRTKVMLRASALAQANGFQFVKGIKEPAYPGIVFTLGDTRRALSVIEGNYKNHSFKILNYSYMEGSGKNRSEHSKGVIMVKLPRKVPNVIFDSKSNDFLGISSIGTTFSRSQKFNFEGDFNNHFDVYAPQNYGRDVLYFMTPELMAILVDQAGNYDVEVVDDNLFFYAPEFDFKKQQLAKIFQLIENVGGEFSENTTRYADERVGDKNINMIAEPGRRLKRGFSWLTLGAIVAYLIVRLIIGIADSP